MSVAEAQAKLAAAGLQPPLLCKPLWTDGREGSHGLAVLHDLGALNQLLEGTVASECKPPMVVQQYVEHGSVLFKVGRGGSMGLFCVGTVHICWNCGTLESSRWSSK